MDAGHDGDANVDVAPARIDREAPVLRHAALGNVELGHDFDARDHLFGVFGSGHAANAGQHTVDAVLDEQAGPYGFDVNVAGAGLEGVVQRGVDETHHRAGVLGDAAQRDVFAPTVARRDLWPGHGIQGPLAVFVACEHGLDVGAQGQAGLRRLAQALLRPGGQRAVEGVRNDQQQATGQTEPASGIAHQQTLVLQGLAIVQQLKIGGQLMQGLHADHGHARAGTQTVEKARVLRPHVVLQGFDHAHAARLRAGAGALELAHIEGLHRRA